MSLIEDFHDVRFPTAISFGATGGPTRPVEVVELVSGHERRNARTAHSRRSYDVGTGIRSLADLREIVAFFEARRGQLHAFRFRDPFDMKSCAPEATPTALDQPIGTGDGENRAFQLAKTYGAGADAYVRPIGKPVAESVLLAVDGMAAEPGSYALDDGLGIVTFVAEQVPPPGATVTAGFEFDVPVRFDTDRVTINLTSFRAGQIPAIPLIEVRI